MSSFRRCLPFLLSLAAAFVALAPATSAAQPLRLAASRSPLSLPVLVAQDRGFFAEEGLEVQVADCIGGHRCLRQVLEGKADVATVGDLPIVFNSFERSDFVVLATIGSNREDTKLVTHRRAGIGRPEDLPGKRVGLVHGSSSHYFFDLFMLSAGVDPKSVQAVRLQPEELGPALLAGRIDAAAIWEPYAYEAMKSMPGQATVLPHPDRYVLTFNLVAARAMARTRDDSLVRLLRAVERAQRFITERPAQAQAILQQRLQLDPQFVEHAWPTLSFRLALDTSLLRTLEGEARWAEREGHVAGRRPSNFLDFVHRGPLLRVKPSAVAIGR